MSDERDVMAKNIKYYMGLKGVKGKQLCDALGFNYNTFMEWVQGEKYPRIEKITKMANYFGCEKSDLIEDGSKRSVPLDNDTIELIELYQKCDNAQKLCIKQMIKYVVRT